MNPLEALHRAAELFRAPDLRRERTKSLISEVRLKLQDLCGDAIFGVQINLSHQQSEDLFPGTGRSIPLPLVATVAFTDPNGGFRCLLERDPAYLVFTLDGEDARVEMELRNVRAKRWYETAAVVPFFGRSLSSMDRKLKALEFGNRLANTLLDVRQESPSSFSNI